MTKNIAAKRSWQYAGAPSDGVNGTLAGNQWLEKGDLLLDTTNGALYQNTNTQASPTWTAVTASAPADGSITDAKLATDVKVGSLVALTTTEKGSAVGAINELDAGKYEKPALGIPLADLVAAAQTSLGLADTALQPGELVGVSGTPVNAVAASGILTLTGVVIDGETVTIGDDVYEFCADAAQSLTGGSDFAADIESDCTKSQGTLTVDTQPTSGDTMTIGSKTFTFVPAGTANADGEISVGTDLATAQAAIVAAINGTDGVNTAHTQVSAAAFGANDSVITALVGGVAGDSIASTETFTSGTNVFDAATLGTTTAGVDCIAANAITALVASITANDTQGVGAADGAGDTIDLTADTKGTAGNAIATTEAMANASFGAATLAGGIDGTVGDQWDMLVDASYLYIAIAANTIADANWRRVSLGAAY